MKIRKITSVKANDDFTIECEMENGEIYKHDMSFIHSEGGEVIEPLKDINVFKKVCVENGYLTWPNGYDLDGTNIAIKGQLIKKTA